jgi:F-type H+-transporting ATPase subunit gamma
MAQIREIKGRMKAVGNIKRITKTMQLIATARFQAAQKRATDAKPYTQKIAELVGELASAGGDIKHPLLEAPAKDECKGKELLLVLTANRGLCGGYNANILRTAVKFLNENKDKQIDIEVVGNKGVGFFKFSEIEVANIHKQFGDKPAFEDVDALANLYMAQFTGKDYDAVHVCYMSFQSVARQEPKVLNLLPLQPPKSDESEKAGGADVKDANATSKGKADSAKMKAVVDYDFSPEPEALLGQLLPSTLKATLFQCFNDATVGEQVARMIAMKAATDAAGKQGKALTRQFNRARQTAITTELTEIISGSAALE